MIAGVTVFVIRTFLIQPFLVNGASMEPNFFHGNYLLVDEITYRFREPSYGETIVFRSPQNRSIFFIKRIIGLPGDKIIIENNEIFINDKQLREEYLSLNIKTAGSIDVKLGEDEYFVLGDNRYNSFDSRNWGSLKRDGIVGLVRLRLFPLTQIEVFGAPVYNIIN